MTKTLALAQRSLREAIRTPEALFPTLFIPLFFLVVNVGQVAKIFPTSHTPFLKGQTYAAFQLPATILLAASFGSAALFLVEDIEGGYFDKLRSAPVARTSLVLGRLLAEACKSLLVSSVIVLAAFVFGVHVASGFFGFLLLIVLTALWGVVYSGFLQLIAMKSRSAAATQSGSMLFFPLLFLTPNFVPRNLLSRPMEVAATYNPVTYIMEGLRSLILDHYDWTRIGRGFARRRGRGVAHGGAQRAHDPQLRLTDGRQGPAAASSRDAPPGRCSRSSCSGHTGDDRGAPGMSADDVPALNIRRVRDLQGLSADGSDFFVELYGIFTAGAPRPTRCHAVGSVRG